MAELTREACLKGLPISGGTVVARVCLANETRHADVPLYKVEGGDVAVEKERLRHATQQAIEQVEAVRRKAEKRIGPTEAAIFAVQRTILEDPVMSTETLAHIEMAGVNAETAVMAVLDHYEARLLEIDNEYIKERATDLGEVKRRLLDALRDMKPVFECANQVHCQRGRDRIVIARELTPGLTMEMDTDRVLGFVTERGGPASHAAILARALGVPAVSSVDGIHQLISCGTEILADGDTGIVVVNPSRETLERYHADRVHARPAVEVVSPVPGFTIMANISRADDVKQALQVKAEGVGLYRTEMEFMAAGRPLTEDEQYERYASVVKAMNRAPVTFRMLDVGGDKTGAFMDLPEEENPSLGFRGARFLLANPELVGVQARALARTSLHGPVNVLYPMVVHLDQFNALRRLFTQAVEGHEQGVINHGVMFEVPSACLQATAILGEADFGSIGTNDLIQYLFAVDRNNDQVAYDFSADRDVLWLLLEQVAQAARETGRPLSVCGEMAGDARYVSRLKALGIDTVSVSPRLIPALRRALR